MIKLKSAYRIDANSSIVFLIHEQHLLSYSSAFLPLLQKLQAGLRHSDIDRLSDLELKQLEQLYAAKAITDTRIFEKSSSEVKAFLENLELINWPAEFVFNQLKHARVNVIDSHTNPSYAQQLIAMLAPYDVIKQPPTLNVYVTDNFNKLEVIAYPAIIIKVGSIKASIGPMLTELFITYDSFKASMLKAKGLFAAETFSVDLPSHLKLAQLAIMFNELLMFIVKTGNHDAAGKMIEWDFALVSRKAWPI